MWNIYLKQGVRLFVYQGPILCYLYGKTIRIVQDIPLKERTIL